MRNKITKDQIKDLTTATTSADGLLSSTDKIKLDGIQSGATANQTNSYLLDRTNHTGTQAISTVTNLQTTLDGKANASHNHNDIYYTETEIDLLLADKSDINHIHEIVDITGLQTALDSKATAGVNSNITSLTGITSGISTVDYIDFDTTATPTGAVGRLSWNDTDGTLEFGLKDGNVTLQIGQEQVQRVTNNTGSTINNGSAVYINGASGNRVTVSLGLANSEPTSSKTFGVLTETILNNQSGYVTTSGLVRNINTSSLTEGSAVYLSPTVSGGLTSTKPTAPNHSVLIGWCVRSHATLGMLFVQVQNGFEIGELHDILLGTLSNNDVLYYESSTGLWKNKQLNLESLSNVSVSSPSVNQVLTWNGTNWVNADSTGVSGGGGGGSTVIDLKDLDTQNVSNIKIQPIFGTSASAIIEGVGMSGSIQPKLGNTYFASAFSGIDNTPYGRTLGCLIGTGTAGSTSANQVNSERGVVNGNGGYSFTYLGGFDKITIGQTRSFIGMYVHDNSGTYQTFSISRNFPDQPAFVGFGTTAGDTNLQLMRRDSLGNLNKIDIGSDFPVQDYTHYRIEIYCYKDLNVGTIYVKITNLFTGATYSNTLTTVIPLASERLGFASGIMSESGSTVQNLSFVSLNLLNNYENNTQKITVSSGGGSSTTNTYIQQTEPVGATSPYVWYKLDDSGLNVIDILLG